jgi:hypothetical protein
MKTVLKIVIFFTIGFSSYCQEKTVLNNLEGFYSFGFENSNFMQMDFENCILISECWTEFAPNLTYKGKLFDLSQIENFDNVYLKVNAEFFTGKSYGHLGAWQSKIIVTEIVEIDINRNFNDCLKKCGKIKKKRKN